MNNFTAKTFLLCLLFLGVTLPLEAFFKKKTSGGEKGTSTKAEEKAAFSTIVNFTPKKDVFEGFDYVMLGKVVHEKEMGRTYKNTIKKRVTKRGKGKGAKSTTTYEDQEVLVNYDSNPSDFDLAPLVASYLKKRLSTGPVTIIQKSEDLNRVLNEKLGGENSFMAAYSLAFGVSQPDEVTKAINDGKVAVIDVKIYGGLSQTFEVRNKTGSFSKMVTSGDQSQVVMEEISYDQFAKGCEAVMEVEFTVKNLIGDKVLGSFKKGSCFMKNEGLQAESKKSGGLDLGLAIAPILAPLGFDMNDLMARIVKLEYTTDVPLDPAVESDALFKAANASFFDPKNRVIPVRLKMATELTRSCVDAFAYNSFTHSREEFINLPEKYGDPIAKSLIKAGVKEYKAKKDYDPETRLTSLLKNAGSQDRNYAANAFLLGLCLDMKKDLTRAKQYYGQAVKLDGSNKDFAAAFNRLKK